MHTIDVRGVRCPTYFAESRLCTGKVIPGDVVRFLLDKGEQAENIPGNLEAGGHSVLGLEEKSGYCLLTLLVSAVDTKRRDRISEYPSMKITRNGREPATDPVMIEETIDVIVNGRKLTSIVTTTDLHRELAVGHMITEGVVREQGDILDVTEKDGRVFLTIRGLETFEPGYELRTSGFMGMQWDKRVDDMVLPVHQTFTAGTLLDSVHNLYDATQNRTGGAHTASLVDSEGSLKFKALDIGRHNAIDKVVGMAVLNCDDLTRMFLVSSGRQPAGMVMKAARAGIPLIISKAAPISSGVDSALRTNITLCCYATSEKFKAFSAPERIVHAIPADAGQESSSS